MAKNPRRLKVGIVGDSREYLISLEEVLTQGLLKNLSDVDVETASVFVDDQIGGEGEKLGFVHRRISQIKPDIILLNEAVSKVHGEKIALELRESDIEVPLIAISSGVLKHQAPYTDAPSISDSYEGLERGVFDTVWRKGDNEDLGRKIRENAWKAVDVGIIGGGGLTVDMVKYLRRDRNVRSVKVYSENSPIKDNNSFYKLLVQIPKVSKVKIASSLDEVIKDTDVLVLASSTLRSYQVDNVVKNADRREALPYEISKYNILYKGLLERRFDGLVMPLANPVHLLSFFWMQNHGDVNKVFSPLQPDTDRLMQSLHSEFLERRQEAFLKEASGLFTGVHGKARVITSHKWGRFIARNKEKITRAEEMADRMGRESLEGASIYGMPASDAAETIVSIFADLAHYRNPSVNCQIYYSYGGREGFVGLPTQFSHKSGLSVSVDMDRINELGRNEVNGAVGPFLENQWNLIMNAIANPKSYNQH